MASIVRIKRSGVTTSPTTLASGELAYTWEATTGGKLLIGWGDEINENEAPNITAIGGKFYTDKLNHTNGILTANSAIVVGSNKKINELLVDNITIDTNTIISDNGLIAFGGNRLTNLADPVNDSDAATKGFIADELSAFSQDLAIDSDSGTGSISLTNGSLTIVGGSGIETSITSDVMTISGIDASTSIKGIASFNPDMFTTSSGAVSSKNITIGSSPVTLGQTITTITGLVSVSVGNIVYSDNTITALNEDGNISIIPNGDGHVNVNNSLLRGVLDPIVDTDAANKRYVDSVAQGLNVKEGVDAATTDTLENITGGTVTYDNGVDGVGATLNFDLGSPFTVVDGVSVYDGMRIIVKNQTNRIHNGIYVVLNSYSIERDPNFNSDESIEGGDFVFVVEGTQNAGTGWVQIATVNDVGIDEIIFDQFSGAGTYLAGSGLTLNGNEFSVNVDGDTIEIIGNQLRVRDASITNVKLANSTIVISADSGTANGVALGEILTIAGGEGINTLVTDNQILISGELASDTNKGIASFDVVDFTTNAGNVTLKSERIQDIISTFLVDGDAITISYNDAGNELIIDADIATTTTLGVASFSTDNFAVSVGGEVTVTSIDGGSF